MNAGDSDRIAKSRMRLSLRLVAGGVATVVCLVLAFRIVDFRAVGAALTRIQPEYAGLVVVLLFCNTLVTIVRFRTVLSSLGYVPAWMRLIGAFSVGSIGNQFVLNIIGQSIGRAGALTACGVPFGATIIATFVERILAAGILALVGVASAWILLPQFGFDIEQGGAYFLFLVVGVTTTSCVAVATACDRGVVARFLSATRRVVLRFWPAVLLTVLAHLLMLGGYVAALLAFGLETPTLQIAGAVIIVMFVAGLPISLGGWGIRELSAVAALGAVGIDSPMALAAALVVGVFSLVTNLAIAFPGLFLALIPGERPELEAKGPNLSTRWNARLVMGCAVLTAVSIFFQVQIQGGSRQIVVNAADLFALTGLGSLLLLLVNSRERIAALPFPMIWPLLGLTLLFAYGLVLGCVNFGASNWALLNRGLGWLLILGYVALGLSIGLVYADRGRRVVLLVFVAAGTAVAALQILFLILVKLGIPLPMDAFPRPLRGYANNGNAFGLQMTTTAIAAVVADRLGVLGVNRRWLIRILILTGLAIFFTSSRSSIGMFTMLLLMSVALALPRERPAAIKVSLVVAIGVGTAAVAIIYMPALTIPEIDLSFLDTRVLGVPMADVPGVSSPKSGLDSTGEAMSDGRLRLRTSIVVPGSDAQRWKTIVDGWQLWLERPVFGHGLGAYVHSQLSHSETLVVFHSVPVWLMAEMGIVGLILGTGAFVYLMWGAIQVLQDPTLRNWGIGLVMILVCWGAATLVHDYAYQRVFWFFLGLAYGVWPAEKGVKARRARSLRSPENQNIL